MMSTQVERKFIDIVAVEMASAICEAVGHWMAEVDAVLLNEDYSPQRKLDEIAWIVSEYKALSHNRELRPRTAGSPPSGPQRSCGVGI